MDRQVAKPMQAFRVVGTAPFGRQRQQFTQDVVASNKEEAIDRIYSIIGSRHRAKRRAINIESCKKIKPTDSSNPIVINTFREDIEVSVPSKTEEE